ncbi:ISNCY family transposase, partial [Rhizobium ruizarguesonis]
QQTRPKVKSNIEKNGYTPRGRKPGRKTDFMDDPSVISRREKALLRQPAAE